MVALAAASIVIIIMVVACLCVKSKSYKYKGNNLILTFDQNCLQTEKKERNPNTNRFVLLHAVAKLNTAILWDFVTVCAYCMQTTS